MIEFAAIKSIIEQYEKHDWKLRRVMLSPSSVSALGANLAELQPGVEVIKSASEGLWFSRRTLPDREAWELRRLSGSPFALVAVIEDSLSKDDREDMLSSVESRMFDGSHPEPTSH
jgi:hypothetical protein